MSDPISKSKFCTNILGVKPQFIVKIENRLTLVKVKGKKIPQVDLHGTETLEYLKERDIKIKEADPIKPEPEIKKPRPPGNNPSGNTKTETNNNSDPDDLDDVSKTYLEKKKIISSTKKTDVETDQKRGDLIRKSIAILTFNALGSIDENQIKSLNVKLSPKIDAIYTRFFSVATERILKLLVKEDDQELKTEISKILNSGSEQHKKDIIEITEDETGTILINIKKEFDLFLERAEAEAK